MNDHLKYSSTGFLFRLSSQALRALHLAPSGHGLAAQTRTFVPAEGTKYCRADCGRERN
jgi:hypothetical protein